MSSAEEIRRKLDEITGLEAQVENLQETVRSLEEDVDVQLVRRLSWAADVEYIARLTGEQKHCLLNLPMHDKFMVVNLAPEFFGLYAGMRMDALNIDHEAFAKDPARTLVEWMMLSNNERSYFLGNFSHETIGIVLRNFDANDPVVHSYTAWYTGSVEYAELRDKELYPDIRDEGFQVRFMKWFHKVDEKQVFMETFSEMMRYSNESDKEVLEAAMKNPLFFKAGRKYLEASRSPDGIRLTSSKVYDFVRDEKSSKSLLDYQGAVSVWAEICEGTAGWSVELENADLEKVGEVFERLLAAEHEREDRHLYLEGLKQNIKSGTAREYCDYILTEMNKGVIGGGNYRQVFARKAV